MVEFTLIFPVLAILLFGVIQFGIVFNHYLAVTDAVRAGARQAAVARYLPAGEREAKVRAKVSVRKARDRDKDSVRKARARKVRVSAAKIAATISAAIVEWVRRASSRAGSVV